MDKPPQSGAGSVQPAAESDDLDRRRKTLDSGLHDARKRHAPPADPAGRGQALGMAFRIATELVAALLVGGFIGWQLDRWLETRPALFLLFLALGAAAGMRNVFSYAYRMNRLAQGSEDDGKAGPQGPEQR